MIETMKNAPSASKEQYYNNYVKGIADNPILLTDAQIESLALRYDPENMTPAEYEAFLDALVQFGALPKDELPYMDYGVVRIDGWIGEDGLYYSNNGGSLIPTSEAGKLLRELSDAEGNIMVWARAYAALLNQLPLIEPGTNIGSLRSAALYKNLIPILDEMSAIRKAS